MRGVFIQSSGSRILAPAANAVKYHTIIYPDAIHHKTKYMGKPSPELDAAWEEEYDLISRIPKWQADQIETPSDELADDPGEPDTTFLYDMACRS